MTKRLTLAAHAARINEPKPYGGRGLDKLGEISAVPALPDQLLHDARVAVCDRANGPDDARHLLEHLGLTQPADQPREAPVPTPHARPRTADTARPDDSWLEQAACRGEDPEAWFSHDDKLTERALKVCNTQCPVRALCLQRAMDLPIDYGVAGGMDEDDRRRYRRNRSRRKEAAA